jgi:hypothetical protein
MADLKKLHLACGQTKRDGWINIDIVRTQATDMELDLLKFPWPFENESCDELYSSHFIEHIPMAYTESGQDLLCAFMDECYRVLIVNGKATFIFPWYNSVRCWQDPTHRRAISDVTFAYFNKGWRNQMSLGHYNIGCDFDFAPSYNVEAPWAGRTEEMRAFAMKHYVNVVQDGQVLLTKRAPE